MTKAEEIHAGQDEFEKLLRQRLPELNDARYSEMMASIVIALQTARTLANVAEELAKFNELVPALAKKVEVASAEVPKTDDTARRLAATVEVYFANKRPVAKSARQLWDLAQLVLDPSET